MTSRDPEFRLWAYISADLHRQYRLRSSAEASTGRLLLSAASPRFLPVLLYRVAYWLYCWRLSPLAKLVSLLNFVIFGIEIGLRCRMGPGLFLPHTQGTVIGARRIGSDATIYQGVTIGARELDLQYTDESRPTIGDGVIIGSGAKVLGPIHIGDGAKIGANAVVVRSVPDNSTAVGSPAAIAAKPTEPMS